MIRRFALCGFMFLCLLTGCTNIQAVVQNAAKIEFLKRIDAAETQWKAKGVKSYRLSVQVVLAWRLQTDSITVQNGAVTGHSAVCGVSVLESGGKCELLAIDPQTLTIEELFQKARNLVNSASSDKYPTDAMSGLSFQFDPTYGYPVQIASSSPHISDTDVAWIVEKFEPGK